jgi:lipoprotein-anchoring transpeptidase ErfK/SrfK
MSNALRQIGRFSLIALVVGFAPAASAIGRAGAATPDADPAASPTASRATLQAVAETADPGAIQSFVDQAVETHRVAVEDRRIGRQIEAEASALRPGRFVWKADHVQSGPMSIVVSLSAQRAYVFRDRRLVAVSTVSTGRATHRTPTGTFPILQKNRDHFSNIYDNAPMPNMQRLTWDGVALHAGVIPGYPASHGCVRLPMEFSRLLFGATKMGEIIHVIADTPTSEMRALEHAEAAQAAREARAAERQQERAARRSRAS